MRFSTSQSRIRSIEAIVPMISVVFLLLVFFLMTALLVPGPSQDVSLPFGRASDGKAGTADVLYLSSDGQPSFGSVTGARALSLASAVKGPLDLRADAAVPATDLADLLDRLAATGVRDVRLITVRP
ncbi:MAG: biopolymer transporter ExbD [Pseudomonadota bacterium]